MFADCRPVLALLQYWCGSKEDRVAPLSLVSLWNMDLSLSTRRLNVSSWHLSVTCVFVSSFMSTYLSSDLCVCMCLKCSILWFMLRLYHTSDFKTGTLEAISLDAGCCGVSARIDWLIVSILWLGHLVGMIAIKFDLSFFFSMAICTIVYADPSLRL